ncbi:MAG: TonB-dependent receptor, partial [Desulfobacteraceae bacterium]
MDQKNQRRFKNLLIFCLLLCLGVSNSVLAQDDDTDDEFTLEEIIVTAEKREAEVQKIPMDINVVRPNDMQRLGIHTVEDLDKILPDVQTGENAGSFVAVTIRNVTTNFWNPIHETTVAMHLDGVQLTRVNGFNNMFFDLQRLEVLKGPQGTLYGRGSTAGTMNIITQKPILNEFSGYATAELGNYDLQRYEAAINIPIVEKLSIRFAGRFFDHDGYNDSGYSNAHSWGGRVGMNWEPTDKDQIVATIDFEGFDDHGQGGSGSVFGTYGDLTIVPNTFNGTTIVQTLGPTKEIKLPWKSRWFSGNSVVDQAWNDNDSWGMMLQYNRDLSFAHTTIIYGHRSLNEDKSWIWGDPYLTWRSLNTNTLEYVYAPDDGDPTYQNSVWIELSDPTVWVDSITNAHFDSLEAHMTSQKTIAQGDRYEWMVGGLAQDDRLIEYDSGPMPSWVEMTTDTKAVFARATYSVFKDWNLKVGTRYSWDKKQYAGIRGTDDPHDGLNVYDFNYNYSDYMVNLSWVANDNIMSYLQYSKGTKTGNVDYNGNGVPPEILGAWETGLKSRFLNNRLQINGSAYFYDYKNYNEWSTAYKCIEYEGDPNDHICLDVASDPASAHAGG